MFKFLEFNNCFILNKGFTLSLRPRVIHNQWYCHTKSTAAHILARAQPPFRHGSGAALQRKSPWRCLFKGHVEPEAVCQSTAVRGTALRGGVRSEGQWGWVCRQRWATSLHPSFSALVQKPRQRRPPPEAAWVPLGLLERSFRFGVRTSHRERVRFCWYCTAPHGDVLAAKPRGAAKWAPFSFDGHAVCLCLNNAQRKSDIGHAGHATPRKEAASRALLYMVPTSPRPHRGWDSAAGSPARRPRRVRSAGGGSWAAAVFARPAAPSAGSRLGGTGSRPLLRAPRHRPRVSLKVTGSRKNTGRKTHALKYRSR